MKSSILFHLCFVILLTSFSYSQQGNIRKLSTFKASEGIILLPPSEEVVTSLTMHYENILDEGELTIMIGDTQVTDYSFNNTLQILTFNPNRAFTSPKDDFKVFINDTSTAAFNIKTTADPEPTFKFSQFLFFTDSPTRILTITKDDPSNIVEKIVEGLEHSEPTSGEGKFQITPESDEKLYFYYKVNNMYYKIKDYVLAPKSIFAGAFSDSYACYYKNLNYQINLQTRNSDIQQKLVSLKVYDSSNNEVSFDETANVYEHKFDKEGFYTLKVFYRESETTEPCYESIFRITDFSIENKLMVKNQAFDLKLSNLTCNTKKIPVGIAIPSGAITSLSCSYLSSSLKCSKSGFTGETCKDYTLFLDSQEVQTLTLIVGLEDEKIDFSPASGTSGTYLTQGEQEFTITLGCYPVEQVTSIQFDTTDTSYNVIFSNVTNSFTIDVPNNSLSFKQTIYEGFYYSISEITGLDGSKCSMSALYYTEHFTYEMKSLSPSYFKKGGQLSITIGYNREVPSFFTIGLSDTKYQNQYKQKYGFDEKENLGTEYSITIPEDEVIPGLFSVKTYQSENSIISCNCNDEILIYEFDIELKETTKTVIKGSTIEIKLNLTHPIYEEQLQSINYENTKNSNHNFYSYILDDKNNTSLLYNIIHITEFLFEDEGTYTFNIIDIANKKTTFSVEVIDYYYSQQHFYSELKNNTPFEATFEINFNKQFEYFDKSSIHLTNCTNIVEATDNKKFTCDYSNSELPATIEGTIGEYNAIMYNLYVSQYGLSAVTCGASTYTLLDYIPPQTPSDYIINNLTIKLNDESLSEKSQNTYDSKNGYLYNNTIKNLKESDNKLTFTYNEKAYEVTPIIPLRNQNYFSVSTDKTQVFKGRSEVITFTIGNDTVQEDELQYALLRETSSSKEIIAENKKCELTTTTKKLICTFIFDSSFPINNYKVILINKCGYEIVTDQQIEIIDYSYTIPYLVGESATNLNNQNIIIRLSSPVSSLEASSIKFSNSETFDTCTTDNHQDYKCNFIGNTIPNEVYPSIQFAPDDIFTLDLNNVLVFQYIFSTLTCGGKTILSFNLSATSFNEDLFSLSLDNSGSYKFKLSSENINYIYSYEVKGDEYNADNLTLYFTYNNSLTEIRDVTINSKNLDKLEISSVYPSQVFTGSSSEIIGFTFNQHLDEGDITSIKLTFTGTIISPNDSNILYVQNENNKTTTIYCSYSFSEEYVYGLYNVSYITACKSETELSNTVEILNYEYGQSFYYTDEDTIHTTIDITYTNELLNIGDKTISIPNCSLTKDNSNPKHYSCTYEGNVPSIIRGSIGDLLMYDIYTAKYKIIRETCNRVATTTLQLTPPESPFDISKLQIHFNSEASVGSNFDPITIDGKTVYTYTFSPESYKIDTNDVLTFTYDMNNITTINNPKINEKNIDGYSIESINKPQVIINSEEEIAFLFSSSIEEEDIVEVNLSQGSNSITNSTPCTIDKNENKQLLCKFSFKSVKEGFYDVSMKTKCGTTINQKSLQIEVLTYKYEQTYFYTSEDTFETTIKCIFSNKYEHLDLSTITLEGCGAFSADDEKKTITCEYEGKTVPSMLQLAIGDLKLDKMYITKYAISSETCNEMTTFTMKVTPPNDSEYVLSNLNINLKDDSNSFIQSPEDKTTFTYTKSSLNYINTNIELIFTYGEHSNTITIDTVHRDLDKFEINKINPSQILLGSTKTVTFEFNQDIIDGDLKEMQLVGTVTKAIAPTKACGINPGKANELQCEFSFDSVTVEKYRPTFSNKCGKIYTPNNEIEVINYSYAQTYYYTTETIYDLTIEITFSNILTDLTLFPIQITNGKSCTSSDNKTFTCPYSTTSTPTVIEGTIDSIPINKLYVTKYYMSYITCGGSTTTTVEITPYQNGFDINKFGISLNKGNTVSKYTESNSVYTYTLDSNNYLENDKNSLHFIYDGNTVSILPIVYMKNFDSITLQSVDIPQVLLGSTETIIFTFYQEMETGDIKDIQLKGESPSLIEPKSACSLVSQTNTQLSCDFDFTSFNPGIYSVYYQNKCGKEFTTAITVEVISFKYSQTTFYTSEESFSTDITLTFRSPFNSLKSNQIVIDGCSYKSFENEQIYICNYTGNQVPTVIQGKINSVSMEKIYISKYSATSETCNGQSSIVFTLYPPNDSDIVKSKYSVTFRNSTTFNKEDPAQTVFTYILQSSEYDNKNVALKIIYGEKTTEITIDEIPHKDYDAFTLVSIDKEETFLNTIPETFNYTFNEEIVTGDISQVILKQGNSTINPSTCTIVEPKTISCTYRTIKSILLGKYNIYYQNKCGALIELNTEKTIEVKVKFANSQLLNDVVVKGSSTKLLVDLSSSITRAEPIIVSVMKGSEEKTLTGTLKNLTSAGSSTIILSDFTFDSVGTYNFTIILGSAELPLSFTIEAIDYTTQHFYYTDKDSFSQSIAFTFTKEFPSNKGGVTLNGCGQCSSTDEITYTCSCSNLSVPNLITGTVGLYSVAIEPIYITKYSIVNNKCVNSIYELTLTPDRTFDISKQYLTVNSNDSYITKKETISQSYIYEFSEGMNESGDNTIHFYYEGTKVSTVTLSNITLIDLYQYTIKSVSSSLSVGSEKPQIVELTFNENIIPDSINSLNLVSTKNSTVILESISCDVSQSNSKVVQCTFDDLVPASMGEYTASFTNTCGIKTNITNITIGTSCLKKMLENGKCVNTCPSDVPYDHEGVCIATCDDGLFFEGTKCVSLCSDGSGTVEGDDKYKSNECVPCESNGMEYFTETKENYTIKKCIPCKEGLLLIESKCKLPDIKINTTMDKCEGYCYNGGNCTLISDIPKCTCLDGFSGITCIFNGTDEQYEEISKLPIVFNNKTNFTVEELQSDTTIIQVQTFAKIIAQNDSIEITEDQKTKINTVTNTTINQVLASDNISEDAIKNSLQLLGLSLTVDLLTSKRLRNLETSITIEEYKKFANELNKKYAITTTNRYENDYYVYRDENGFFTWQGYINTQTGYQTYKEDSKKFGYSIVDIRTCDGLNNQTIIIQTNFNEKIGAIENPDYPTKSAINAAGGKDPNVNQQWKDVELSTCTNVNWEMDLSSALNADLYEYYNRRGIDIYNPNDSAFQDDCFVSSNFDYDLTQEYRRQLLFQNLSIVPSSSDCTYKGVNVETNKLLFSCSSYQQSMTYTMEPTTLGDIQFKHKEYLPLTCPQDIDKIHLNIAFWLYLIGCSFIIGFDIFLAIASIKKFYPNYYAIAMKKDGLVQEELPVRQVSTANEGDQEKQANYVEMIPFTICLKNNFLSLHPVFSLRHYSILSTLLISTWLLIFNLLNLFGFNALFFNETMITDRIYDTHRDNFGYPMKTEFEKIMSSIAGSIVLALMVRAICLVTYSQKQQLSVEIKTKGKEEAIKTFNKKMLIRRIIACVFMLFVNVFFYYYAVVFCGMYVNTQYGWFYSGLWSVFFNYLAYAPIYIVIISLIESKGNNVCAYYMKMLFVF